MRSRYVVRVWSAVLVALTVAAVGRAEGGTPPARFAIVGDGTIKIRSTKNAFRFEGRYRTAQGRYLEDALRRIDQVFGAPAGPWHARVSLRLIEALAFLRNGLEGGWIVVSSGYRSPEYNKALRDKGRTVAKASLHQYGMAADLKIEGIATKEAWLYARRKRVGGAGYYNSPWMHLDVGPTRFWTQSTANVRKGLSEHNKRIILVPQYDIYTAGETVRLRFARMTAYPIGVRGGFALERRAGKGWRELERLTSSSGQRPAQKCWPFENIAEAAGFEVTLPGKLPRGRYRLRASFCDSRWEAMPAEIPSYPFTIRR